MYTTEERSFNVSCNVSSPRLRFVKRTWLRLVRARLKWPPLPLSRKMYYTGPQKKVEWTLHVSILPLWILSRWIRIRSQNYRWTPQFYPSLGEMREILEISVSVKAILIYAILNNTIMITRISSRLVRISLWNLPRVPQNSTSLGEKVLS